MFTNIYPNSVILLLILIKVGHIYRSETSKSNWIVSYHSVDDSVESFLHESTSYCIVAHSVLLSTVESLLKNLNHIVSCGGDLHPYLLPYLFFLIRNVMLHVAHDIKCIHGFLQ